MRSPAEVFHPGEFVREELEAREWSQVDLASILARPPRLVSELINGSRNVSPETANGLGEAFGTGAEFWLGLQNAYDLHRSAGNENEQVARRAKLFSIAPVREMIARGWIETSESVDVLEKRVCDFLEIDNVDERPRAFSVANRTSLPEPTLAQRAWAFRARRLARAVPAERFTNKRFDKCLSTLRGLLADPIECRHIASHLAAGGIRAVVVEPLPKTRIDGACLWLDRDSPVVVISLRYDRIDSLWYTLAHELGHVKYRHAQIDIDLEKRSDEAGDQEQQADRFAREFLVPQDQLEGFIARVRPLYSHKQIIGFADTIGVHPGLVVGQLHFRGEIGYQHSRKMLVRVRSCITESTLTDGWGSILPAKL